jgi:hypothetical protein
MAVDPPPPSDPDRIGKHEIVRRFGSGGQAAAFLGFDPILGRHVVLKQYNDGDTLSCRSRSPTPTTEPFPRFREQIRCVA